MFRLPRLIQWVGGVVMALLAVLGLIDVPDQWEVVRKWMDRQGADQVRLVMVAVGMLGFLYFALNERIGRWFNPVSILDACLTSPPMWRLGVKNRGRTERFRVKVSELAGAETDADEEPWNLPWRLGDAHYHEIQHGETEVVNLAEAEGDDLDPRAGVKIAFFSQSVDRFSRTLWPGGFAVGVEVFAENGNGARARRRFLMMLDEAGDPVLVPHPGWWPRLTARIAGWRVNVVRWFKVHRPSIARLRVRVAEQIAPESQPHKVPVVGGTMPTPSGELEVVMVEQEEASDDVSGAQPEPAGSGIHHEVKWIGMKYPNDYSRRTGRSALVTTRG